MCYLVPRYPSRCVLELVCFLQHIACNSSRLLARGIFKNLHHTTGWKNGYDISVAIPENPHDSEELRDSADLRELSDVRRVDEGDADEVGEDGEQVDDVHRALHELELARRGDQSYLQRHFGLGGQHNTNVEEVLCIII